MSKGSLAVAYSMKRKKMAAGGSVESGDKTMNMSKGGGVKGVHKSEFGKNHGESVAGVNLRLSDIEDSPNMHKQKAVDEHRKVLGELKSMKGPHGNYADGGMVADEESNDFDYVEKNDLVSRAMKRKKR